MFYPVSLKINQGYGIVKDIHINLFRGRKDSRVLCLPTSWKNFVGFLTSGHEVVENKGDAKLFNAVKYKSVDQIPEHSEHLYQEVQTGATYARRRLINIESVNLLILDYDDSISIDEAKERFKEYEYVCYSSFRHLYDDKTHKFRFIIPLTKPIPAWITYNEHGVAVDGGEWYQIRSELESFAGPCDPASFNPNQIYEMPCVPISRIEKSFSEYNKGKYLNWELFERIPFLKYDTDQSIKHGTSIVESSDEYLSPDYVVQTKKGEIRLGDVTGKINGVLCPSPTHNDRNPTEFVKKVESTGNIFIYCSKCRKKYYMRRNADFAKIIPPRKSKNTSSSQTIIKSERIYTADDLLEFDYEGEYFDAQDRTRVLKQLRDIQDKIQQDKGIDLGNGKRRYKSHILYMPEGSGKSRLVIDMAKAGNKIIFACKSWEQIESKYYEYYRAGIKEGFNVKVVRSKDAKARKRFGSKVVRGNPSGPFSTTL